MRDREPNPIVWLIVTVIILALSGVGVWVFRVLTSEIKGQGDAIIQRNSAENWTAAQARFEDMYAEVVATDRKVTAAWEAYQADAENLTAKQTYYGTQNVCYSMVADYNAEARKFLSEDFRSADLPAQIDEFDTATDCK